MSHVISKEEENLNLYDVLNHILPRYVRFSSQHSQHQIDCHLQSLSSSIIEPSQSGTFVDHKLQFHSKHLGEWYALPGGIEVGSLKPIENGIYPMDISSALPVSIFQELLRLQQLNNNPIEQQHQQKPKTNNLKLLDLCCSPGSKFQLISDCIHNLNNNIINQTNTNISISSSLLVGVDISIDRLNVCKSLIHKWRLWSAKEAIESTISNGCNNNNGSDSSSNGNNKSSNSSSFTSTKLRQMLFHADGTTFGSHNIGNLIFDSQLWEFELMERMYHGNGNIKQRSNNIKIEKTCNGVDDDGEILDSSSGVLEKNNLLTSPSSSLPLFQSQTTATNQLKPRFSKRKRMNKSALHREKKRLKDLEQLIKLANHQRNVSLNKSNYSHSYTKTKLHETNDTEHTPIFTVSMVQSNTVTNTAAKSATDPATTRNNTTDKNTTLTLKEGITTIDNDEDDLCMADFDFVFVDAECSHTGSYRHMVYIDESNSSDTNDYSGGSSNCISTDENMMNGDHNVTTETPSDIHPPIITTTTTSTTFQKPTATRKFQNHQSDTASLQTLQRQLILNGYNSLKPYGYLIYSTCCVSDTENEEIVQWLLDNNNTTSTLDPGKSSATDINNSTVSSDITSDSTILSAGVVANTTTASSVDDVANNSDGKIKGENSSCNNDFVNQQQYKPILIPCPLSIIQYELAPQQLVTYNNSSSNNTNNNINHSRSSYENSKSANHKNISNVMAYFHDTNNNLDIFSTIESWTDDFIQQLLHSNDDELKQFISHMLLLIEKQLSEQVNSTKNDQQTLHDEKKKSQIDKNIFQSYLNTTSLKTSNITTPLSQDEDPTIINRKLESKLLFQRLSNRISKYISQKDHFPVQQGKLPGTIKCSRNVGMSGLFIAIIQKVPIN